MEEIRQAIIKENGDVLCPYCFKKNAQLTGSETIRNFRVRCRGSSGKLSHYFMLNAEKEEKENG